MAVPTSCKADDCFLEIFNKHSWGAKGHSSVTSHRDDSKNQYTQGYPSHSRPCLKSSFYHTSVCLFCYIHWPFFHLPFWQSKWWWRTEKEKGVEWHQPEIPDSSKDGVTGITLTLTCYTTRKQDKICICEAIVSDKSARLWSLREGK